MKRIHPISKMPDHAAAVSPEVKITFVISILQASVPLFTNKNPQNPLPPDDTPSEGEGEA